MTVTPGAGIFTLAECERWAKQTAEWARAWGMAGILAAALAGKHEHELTHRR